MLVLQGLSAPAWAQDTPLSEGLAAVPSRMRVTAERVKLPGNEDMGLVGTTYSLEVLPSVWAGPAAYGAISGSRGGLLVVGAEIGWRSPSFGPLSLGAGYFAGGGGGGSAPVGGGLMLRPHVDLMWSLSPTQSIGLSWSQVRFPKGGLDANGNEARIDSKQIGLVWNVDSYFRFMPRERLNSSLRTNARTGIGFDRMQALAGVYRPTASSRRLDGSSLPSNVGFAGARLEQALDDGWFWGIEAAGAASGGVSGYAEYLGTLGIESLVGGESLAIGARGAVGMGGGGTVDTGGGLLVKASGYGIVRLASDLGLTLEGGAIQAPQGSFKARYASLAFTWILDDRIDTTAPARITRMEWVGGVESYRAPRRDGSTRQLQAVSLRVNREMTPGFYLSAQAHSAVGGGAGGYSVGLLGAGLRRDFSPRWHAGIEALGGAAGGGGVDTAGGAIVQPMAYLGYEITPGVALRVGAGRIQALRGPLKADVVEMSLAFTFGVASRGYR